MSAEELRATRPWPERQRTTGQLFWRRLTRNRLALVGLSIVALLAAVAIFAPWIAPRDPSAQILEHKRQPPSAAYPLGTDEFGRDILSRLIFGSRVALLAGGMSVFIALMLGTALGTISAYFGRLVDQVVMRMMDVLLAFPYLLLAIVIISALGPGLVNTILAVGIWATPGFARVIRSAVLSVKQQEYVQAARAIGASAGRVITRHILPNCISVAIVYSALYMANAILLEAALSFLGLGVQPPTPSWGLMVSTGRDFLLIAPHIATFPGLAIAVTVLGFNLLGDGLRDALDPRT
ncbi:MAG: ABC transporter permease [Armatimonadota bacterium]|nr:ABC transporter permease [Armatimonadota bacterium]MDR7401881.1 ABC transporter permease [Armatimonadota bacterium]MDR7472068.1 ABC transporter permease [Armatimonadota bacterium]MDR7507163.1 ABC transporter permease [Armatimonadota bacterium]MDR7517089.1 ABC transporter permease [Armatimonadota bacterium]